MYLCYIDESGTPDIPGNTSHFVLAGLSVPIWHWKGSDSEVSALKKKYSLASDAEIHTGWMLRKYLEQKKIPNFDALPYTQRRIKVEQLRNTELYRLQKLPDPTRYHQTRKNFRKTADYVHLTYDERRRFISEVARAISGWGYARLFAECVDKVHFNPVRTGKSVVEQAFEQVVSRFEQYLQTNPSGGVPANKSYGLLIHDNNDTVAKRHTELMKNFHKKGTLWTGIDNIMETPLFVESHLTSMVQLADVCCYAMRRYLENNESDLFDLVFTRADRRYGKAVGVRHYTNMSCTCKICAAHR